MPEFRGKLITNDHLLDKKSITNWKRLDLIRTLVDDDGIIKLCGLARSLEEVQIQSDRISDASMPALCSLPVLVSLLLSEVPQVTDKGIESIARLRQLCELYLDGTQMTDAGADALTDLQNIWSLSLRGTRVTDIGVSKLGALRGLKIVCLDQTLIEGSGLQQLPNTQKISVYLNGCAVSESSLAEFITSHQLIKILSMNDTGVGDELMPKIAALTGLEDLRLHGTAVTNKGMRSFLGHPTLGMLYVERTAVTSAMAIELKARSPQSLIVYYDGKGT